MKKWIALFSHTGSEIVNISDKIGRWPDAIISNKVPGSEDIHEGIVSGFSRETGNEVMYCSNNPKVPDYRLLLDEDAVITMHGWMRIVPKPICKEYEIYNLHPGLITEYPELKGKDPQKKVVESKLKSYERVGCVIHRAVAEVDAGEVLMETSVLNTFYSEQLLTEYLHDMDGRMWTTFLEDKLE